ncbi:MAG: BamA/TamA family outer membrane protein [Pseudomonadota bacterium]
MTSQSAAATLTVAPGDEALEEALSAEARVLALGEDATAGDVIATARGDYRRVLAALYDRGYFGATVSITLAGREAAALSTIGDSQTVRPVAVTVALGPQYNFGTAEISPPAPPRPSVVGVDPVARETGFVPGAVARTSVIQSSVAQSVDDWRAASYAKAEVVDQRIVADHRRDVLDVSVNMDPGPALSFGSLVVSGDGAVSEERVRQIAGIPRGAPFAPDTVALMRSRLVGTGTFSSVVMSEAEVPGPGDTLDILVDLTAAKPRRLGFGAEVETNKGLSLEAFWLHRNIFGGAERLRFDIDIEDIGGSGGGVDSAATASLTIPGFRRADDTLELFTGIERLRQDDFDESLFELTGKRTRAVNRELEVSAALGVRVAQAEGTFGQRDFRHVIVSVEGIRDKRRPASNPTRGSYAALELRPFIGVAGSETGLRAEADFRGYRSFGSETVLAGRLQFGAVVGAERAETPPQFLFYSGGGGTVRGQGYQSLGADAGGVSSGGRGFAAASFELRRDISDALSLVGFADVGAVSEDAGFNDVGSHGGAGFGLRYNTGLGPLRLDIGVPVGGSTDGDTRYGIYIGLGQSF